MTPFKEERQHSILKHLYNRKHKWGRLVVENAFGILKKTFRELQNSELHVAFLFDVFTCSYLLHNLLRSEGETSIVWLLWIIKLEVGVHEQRHHRAVYEPMNQAWIKGQERYGNVIWRELMLYLSRQKNFQWIINEFIIFTFCQIKHEIKNVESFFLSMHFNSHNLLPCIFIPSNNFFHWLAFSWTMVDFVWCYNIFMVARYFSESGIHPQNTTCMSKQVNLI